MFSILRCAGALHKYAVVCLLLRAAFTSLWNSNLQRAGMLRRLSLWGPSGLQVEVGSFDRTECWAQKPCCAVAMLAHTVLFAV